MNTSQRVIDYIKDVAEFIPTKDGLISASKLLEQFLPCSMHQSRSFPVVKRSASIF